MPLDRLQGAVTHDLDDRVAPEYRKSPCYIRKSVEGAMGELNELRDARTTWMLSRPTATTIAVKMRLEPTRGAAERRVHPGHDWFFVIDERVRLSGSKIAAMTGRSRPNQGSKTIGTPPPRIPPARLMLTAKHSFVRATSRARPPGHRHALMVPKATHWTIVQWDGSGA